MHMLLQIDQLLNPLRLISPRIQHIKLDKKKEEEFPELLGGLKGHTHSAEFMIQFFDHFVIKQNCNCKACSGGIFKPVRMPQI
jgi:hypothetical protein